jgi:uroporphyrinogen decarboxylase
MSRKQLALDVFHNQAREIVPFGFWFHFSPFSVFANAPGDAALFQKTLEGHKRYFHTVGSPILKIMTEGYFAVPGLKGIDVKDPEALAVVRPTDPNHPWFEEQLELTRQLAREVKGDAAVIYTLFSPISYLAYVNIAQGGFVQDDVFADLLRDHPQALSHALGVVADDIAGLGRRLVTQGGADGIFVSVRNYKGIVKQDYQDVLAPGEKKILADAQDAGGVNFLHICGSFGSGRNDFSLYTDYAAQVINWAVGAEKLSLAEGKALFPGRAVLGGFDNAAAGLLVNGTKEEIQAYTKGLLAGAERKGLILGADCALPNEIDYQRLLWVKEIAETL